MPDPHGPSVLVQATIFLAAAVIAVPLFRKFRLGSILGYLAAGVVIGPNGFAFFANPTAVMHVAEFGVILFLFLIGLELNLTRLWNMRRDIFGLGAGQVVISGALAMLFPLLVVGRAWQAALIAGLGLALSSTALVMQLLEERGQVQSPHGQKAFAILLFQDLAVVPLLALVAILSPQQATDTDPMWLSGLRMLGAVATVILAGRYLLNPLFRVLAGAGNHPSPASSLGVVLAQLPRADARPRFAALRAIQVSDVCVHSMPMDASRSRGRIAGKPGRDRGRRSSPVRNAPHLQRASSGADTIDR